MQFAKRRDIRKISIRFRMWFDGRQRRITLAPGQQVTFSTHRTTEEGWGSEAVSLTLENRVLRKEWVTDGCDCDGRLTRDGHSSCLASARAKVRAVRAAGETAPRERYPAWQRLESWQRDEFAEKMGY